MKNHPFDDPRILYNAKTKNNEAFNRLKELKTEREKLDSKIRKLNSEKIEFEKYANEESIKIEDHLKTINECKIIINDENLKQENYRETIKLITQNHAEQSNEVVRNAKTRIENYRPYEEFISKVIAENPRYENVFDLIEHIQEMVFIRSLGSKLKLEPGDADNKNKYNSNEIQSKLIQKDKIVFNTDSNDARTKANITSKYGSLINSNPINPNYLKNDLEKMEDKRKHLENQIPKQIIRTIHKENYLVKSSILHQYREIYFQNNRKLPTNQSLSLDEQLKYIFEFYKKNIKRLDIYKTLDKS